jgi:uncharacterized protein (DUF433 family)
MLTLEEELARLPIISNPEILSGATVFRGTRVPVAALLDNLAAGLTLDEFLDNFPTVTREQAIQVLEFSKTLLSTKAGIISEEEIDRIVIAHADDDSAWEKSIRVHRSISSAVSSPTKHASGSSEENSLAAPKISKPK